MVQTRWSNGSVWTERLWTFHVKLPRLKKSEISLLQLLQYIKENEVKRFIRHCALFFLKLESKIWTLSCSRDGHLATAVCNIGHSWTVIVASKGDAHLTHLSGTISVQTSTEKKRTLVTSCTWYSIPVKSIKIKHSFEAYSLKSSLSMVAHNVTKPLQSGSHVTSSSS